MLDKIDLQNVPASAEVWEKVIRKLRGNAMPPPGLPHPDKAFYEAFPAYLDTAIDRAALAKLNPGRPTIHRLNRVEYANAVHDLLAVDIDGEALLPPDDSVTASTISGMCCGIADAHGKMLTAAHRINRLAIGIQYASRRGDVYPSEGHHQNERMSEDLRFVRAAAWGGPSQLPADGEYTVKTMQRDGDPVNWRWRADPRRRFETPDRCPPG
jgi:hypothetical protein